MVFAHSNFGQNIEIRPEFSLSAHVHILRTLVSILMRPIADNARILHRTSGLRLVNYFPDRVVYYRKCPTVRQPFGNTGQNLVFGQYLENE